MTVKSLLKLKKDSFSEGWITITVKVANLEREDLMFQGVAKAKYNFERNHSSHSGVDLPSVSASIVKLQLQRYRKQCIICEQRARCQVGQPQSSRWSAYPRRLKLFGNYDSWHHIPDSGGHSDSRAQACRVVHLLTP